jgi:soluble lytic murein transglycosylase-like protein
MFKLIALIFLSFVFTLAQANDSRYALLSASTTTVIPQTISDQAIAHQAFSNTATRKSWLAVMSLRLKQRIPDQHERDDFLSAVFYEAKRAGLDPQVILSVIQVESGFKKYAISSAGARGYMQIMPFWVDTIGTNDHNLFHLRVNLRYGCTILRHYLDIEKGDYFRALGRYNGSLGRVKYPKKVFNAWKKTWAYSL